MSSAFLSVKDKRLFPTSQSNGNALPPQVEVAADFQVSFSRLVGGGSVSFLAVSVSPPTVSVIKISCLCKHRQMADGGKPIPEQ